MYCAYVTDTGGEPVIVAKSLSLLAKSPSKSESSVEFPQWEALDSIIDGLNQHSKVWVTGNNSANSNFRNIIKFNVVRSMANSKYA